jgi:quercetin dioxygenase-like cupin family protein
MRPLPTNRSLWIAVIAAAVPTTVWLCREAAFAQQTAAIKNTVLNTADVKYADHSDAGKVVGKVGVYFNGVTGGTKNFMSGRFVLYPGLEPHAPHRHPEEEILIVAEGVGEVYCDGKTYKVEPGAIMYAGANVEHGIKNLGKEPLVFYWVKFIPTGGK